MFDAKMDSASGKLNKFGKDAHGASGRSGHAFKTIGQQAGELGGKLLAVLGPIEAVRKAWEITSEVAEQQEQFTNLAQAIGMSTSQYEQFSAAAKDVGVSQSTLDTSLQYLTRSIGNAVERGGQYQQMFAALGLSAKQLASENPSQQFEQVSQRLREVSNSTQRAALQMQIFGRSSAQLSPLLLESSAALNKAKAQAVELGFAMSRADRTKLSHFQDGVHELGVTFDGLKNTLAAALAPAMESVVSTIQQMIGKGNTLHYVMAGIGYVSKAVADVIGVSFRVVYTGLGTTIMLIDNALSAVTAGLADITGAVGSVMRFFHVGSSAIDGITQDLKNFSQASADTANSVKNHIANIWQQSASGAADTRQKMKHVFTPLAESATHAKDKVASLIKSLQSQVSNFGLSHEQIEAKQILGDKGATTQQKSQAMALLNRLQHLKQMKALHSEASRLVSQTAPHLSGSQGEQAKLQSELAELHKLQAAKAISAQQSAQVLAGIHQKEYALQQHLLAEHQKKMEALAKAAAEKRAKIARAAAAEKKKQEDMLAGVHRREQHTAATTRQFDLRVPTSVLEGQSTSRQMLALSRKQEQHQNIIARATQQAARALQGLSVANLAGA
ncbi:MAG: hypothetical protein KGL39_28690 [Patescibacteria group bacterium]|nr:hypothetical protein [Patescibacteria group bacterium]